LSTRSVRRAGTKEESPPPLNDFFLVAERFLKLIDMPGGRIIVAMGSVVICLIASSLDVPLAERFGAIPFGALVFLLVKDPRGKLLLGMILQLIQRKPLHELPPMLSASDAHEHVQGH